MKRLALALLFVAVAATAASAQECANKSPLRSLGYQQLTISDSVVTLLAPGTAVVTGLMAIPQGASVALVYIRANSINTISNGSTSPTTGTGITYGVGYSQYVLLCGTMYSVRMIRNGSSDATVDVEYFQ